MFQGMDFYGQSAGRIDKLYRMGGVLLYYRCLFLMKQQSYTKTQQHCNQLTLQVVLMERPQLALTEEV